MIHKSKWQIRDEKRRARAEEDMQRDEEEARRRRDEPTSKERMLDVLEEMIGGHNRDACDERFERLAKIMKHMITGEEYYE